MSTYRVLVTGARDWDAAEADVIRVALYHHLSRSMAAGIDDFVLVHGACPTGADAIADAWGNWINDPHRIMSIERHPADWAAHGRAAGPRRNAEMVALGADVCLAFPRGASRGTRGCAALARAAEIPVVVTEGSSGHVSGVRAP